MQAPPDIILQICLISIGMIILSQLISKKIGTTIRNQLNLQEKMQEFQERMQEAQHSPQEMAKLQQEMVLFTQSMMKKQCIPMVGRTLIFIIIFTILNFGYGQYNEIFTFDILFFGRGWFALYFLVSLTFSLVILLIRKGFEKINPKFKKAEQSMDMMRFLQRNLMMSQPNNQMGVYESESDSPALIQPPRTTKQWKKNLLDDSGEELK